MYTIEEYDKEKSKVLKYVLYKKRSKKEVQNKFYNAIENEMLHDIIEELEDQHVHLPCLHLFQPLEQVLQQSLLL